MELLQLANILLHAGAKTRKPEVGLVALLAKPASRDSAGMNGRRKIDQRETSSFVYCVIQIVTRPCESSVCY